MFNLPASTRVDKIIPKNSFDKYTNSKQKKQISEIINKIYWTNKISTETTNLQFKEINEIQLITIELKVQEDIKSILEIIDKAMPYHIIFTIIYGEEIYISTSAKHNHPLNEDNAVIDYSFISEWFEPKFKPYKLELKNNIDFVYKTFCEQFLLKNPTSYKNITSLVEHRQSLEKIERQIDKLKNQIKKSRQFNVKVELNIQLNNLEKELQIMINSN